MAKIFDSATQSGCCETSEETRNDDAMEDVLPHDIA